MTYTPQHLQRWQYEPNYIGEDFTAFYLAPCTTDRDDRCPIRLSNWKAQCAELDALIKHPESGEHTFSSWACGWFAAYLIHETDYAALQAADAIDAALSDYPVLDDSLHSELEHESAVEAWNDYGRSDLRGLLIDALEEYAPEDAVLDWSDRHIDAISDEALDEHFQLYSDVEVERDADGSLLFRMPKIRYSDLAHLTGLALLPPDQEWRREPYPWHGADPSPLAPPLSPAAP